MKENIAEIFLHPTIQDMKRRQRGEENANAQQYNPPEVGIAEPNSPIARPIKVRKKLLVAHWWSWSSGVYEGR